MTTVQKGKHCVICAKQVVDFSKNSKKEVIDYLDEAEGQTCGRFKKVQIDVYGESNNAIKKTVIPLYKTIAASIITILGVINVPIVKYSVDWWNTLHQPASINIFAQSSIHISMLFPLIIMTAAFALFSILIFLVKYNTELIKIKNKGLDRL